MKNKVLIGGMAAVLLVTGACAKSGTSTAPANANTANANKPPASTPTPAAAQASPSAPASNATAGAQDFTLVNETGVVLDKVFIAPHDSDNWEEDILGKDTLANGEMVDIKFDRKETADMWDLRIEDKEGTYIEWENLNLLKIKKVTLKFENKKPTAVTE
jgi:hypothetical protein